MNFLNSWLQGIIVAVVIATIIEMVMPNGNSKKYIKVVLGVYLVFNIIAPIVNKFSSSNFEISSLINIEEYAKKMDTYDLPSTNINIEKSNNENIKQIYISNLKNDIKNKLQEKGYKVEKIEIQIDNLENYKIKEISIYLKEEIDEKKETQNKIEINEIEKVEIQIAKNEVKTNEQNKNKKDTNIAEKTKNGVKQYIAETYELEQGKIKIY